MGRHGQLSTMQEMHDQSVTFSEPLRQQMDYGHWHQTRPIGRTTGRPGPVASPAASTKNGRHSDGLHRQTGAVGHPPQRPPGWRVAARAGE
jgi:hypothetical protein